MTDRRIDQAHDDLSVILRPTLFDGRTEPLYAHAYRRIVLAADDGLGAVDYSRDPVTGSHGTSRPHTGRNELLDQWNEAVRLVSRGAHMLHTLTVAAAPRHPDTVAQRKAAADNARTQPLLCDLCATVGHPANARSTTTCPCYRTDGSIAWQLDGPRTLCEWCQNRAKLLHRLPNPKELRQHRLGHAVGVPVMERKRAEARMLVAGEGAGVGDVQTWSSGDVA